MTSSAGDRSADRSRTLPPVRARRPARPARVRVQPAGPEETGREDHQGDPPLIHLQRLAGNAAVRDLVSVMSVSAAIQRDADEIAIESIVDRLQLAIKNESKTNGDVSTRYVAVDVEKVAAALQGLTPGEGRQVQQSWLIRDRRSLRELLLGTLPSPLDETYLQPGERTRLVGLLDGTVYQQEGPPADPWDPDAERHAVEHRGLEVDVAQLRQALEAKDTDRVLEILARRGGPPNGTAFRTLNDEYQKQWNTGLYVDLSRYLRGGSQQRAEALLEGDAARAAAIGVQQVVDRKYFVSDTLDNRTDRAAIEKAIEQVRLDSGADPEKMQAVLGQQLVGRPGTTVEEYASSDADKATARVLQALMHGSDADVTAARLARLEAETSLTALDLERAIIDTRAKALVAVTTDLAKHPPPEELSDTQRAQREENAVVSAFRALDTSYHAITGRPFSAAVLTTGTAVQQERNQELLRGAGRIIADSGGGDPAQRRSAGYIELDLAIKSFDSARIRVALSGKTEREIDRLDSEMQAHSGLHLRKAIYALLALAQKGTSVSGVSVNVKELQEIADWLDHGSAYKPKTGGDRQANLLDEGNWYWSNIQRLYDRTMAGRGLFAELRDWAGNLEHNLVDRAKDRAELAHDKLVRAAGIKSMKSGAEEVDLVDELRASYRRLKENVDVYTEATRAAFLAFVDLAVNLVSIAVALTTGGAATMVIRGIVATVGTKLVLLQDEYTAGEFVRDVVGQAAGALGGSVATAMAERGIGQLARAAGVAGLKVAPEISALAGRGLTWAADTVGSTAATKVALGGGLSAPSWDEWMNAAAMTLLHKAKGAVSKPAGKGKAGGTHADDGRPVIRMRPEEGIRMVAEMPAGGKLKLLENGRVAVCNSPCRIFDTFAEEVAARFEKELTHHTNRDALDRLEQLRANERRAIDAHDDAAREAIFAEATALNARLDQFRVNQLHARTGVDVPTVTRLITAASDDAALVSQVLHLARNDPARAQRFLDFAGGDRDVLIRLSKLAEKLQRQKDTGGLLVDPRLLPYAESANFSHILGAHTYDYFNEYPLPAGVPRETGERVRTTEMTSFWAPGTSREQVQEYLVEALLLLRTKQHFVSRMGGPGWTRRVKLGNTVTVQVGYNFENRFIGQFVPVSGPGHLVEPVALPELLHVGQVLFGRVRS